MKTRESIIIFIFLIVSSCEDVDKLEQINSAEIVVVDSLISYKNSEFTGEIIEFDNESKIEAKGFVLNGKDHNAYYKLDKNGLIKHLTIFDSGRVVFNQMFYENGFIEFYESHNFFNDTSVITKFYQNGLLKQHGMLYKGRATGISRFYNEDGSLEAMIDYYDGKREGIAKLFDGENKIVASGYYKNEQRVGKWFFVHPNMVDSTYVYYVNGKVDSVVTTEVKNNPEIIIESQRIINF